MSSTPASRQRAPTKRRLRPALAWTVRRSPLKTPGIGPRRFWSRWSTLAREAELGVSARQRTDGHAEGGPREPAVPGAPPSLWDWLWPAQTGGGYGAQLRRESARIKTGAGQRASKQAESGSRGDGAAASGLTHVDRHAFQSGTPRASSMRLGRRCPLCAHVHARHTISPHPRY